MSHAAFDLTALKQLVARYLHASDLLLMQQKRNPSRAAAQRCHTEMMNQAELVRALERKLRSVVADGAAAQAEPAAEPARIAAAAEALLSTSDTAAPWRFALWHAIHNYVIACGGIPHAARLKDVTDLEVALETAREKWRPVAAWVAEVAPHLDQLHKAASGLGLEGASRDVEKVLGDLFAAAGLGDL